MTDQDRINEYAKEIGISALTTKELIESHRHIRSQIIKHNTETQLERHQQMAAAFEAAKQHALAYNYISVERFREMTMGEIADLLSPGSQGG